MDLFASDLPGAPAAGDRTATGSGPPPPRDRTPSADDRIDLDAWTGAPDAGRSPRRWLLVAAVAPWIVLVAILATGREAPSDESRENAPVAPSAAAPSSTATAGTPTPSTAPTPAHGADAAPTPPGLVALGTPTGPSSRGEAVGTAVVAARTWLGSRPPGPALEGLTAEPGAEDRYVEHLVVESVDHPARGAAVVTLRAIVLPVEGDAYGDAQQVRLAVPVSLDADGAALAGTPWRLPAARAALDAPSTTPVEDPDLLLAATDAVQLAGYRDVELAELQRTDGWAWVAHVDAVAPGDDEVRRHAIWLRSDVGRLVVAGAPAPPPTDPTATEPTPTAPETTP